MDNVDTPATGPGVTSNGTEFSIRRKTGILNPYLPSDHVAISYLCLMGTLLLTLFIYLFVTIRRIICPPKSGWCPILKEQEIRLSGFRTAERQLKECEEIKYKRAEKAEKRRMIREVRAAEEAIAGAAPESDCVVM